MEADYESILAFARADEFQDFRQQQFITIPGMDRHGRPIVVISAPDLEHFFDNQGPKRAKNRVTAFGLLLLDSIVNHPFSVVYFDAAPDAQKAPDSEYIETLCGLLPVKHSENLMQFFVVKPLWRQTQ